MLFGICGLGIWGAMLSLSHLSLPTGLGLEEIASLTDGPLPSFFSTVSLLLASQLSFLILWYRSRARKDFMGRYRIWGWAGAFLTVTCLCNATGLHRPAGELLAERWPINCWRPEVMYWLTPFAIGHLTLFRLMSREMRHSRTSLVLWNLSFLLGIAAAGMNLGGEMLFSTHWQTTAVIGVTTLWQLAQAMTFLVHARFVVHVTNEAGPKQISLKARSWSWLSRAGKSAPKRRKKAAKATEPAVEKKPKVSRTKAKPAEETAQPAKDKPSPVRTPLQAKEGSEDADQKSGRWPWSRKKRVLGKTVRMDQESAVPKPHITVKAKGNAAANASEKLSEAAAAPKANGSVRNEDGQDDGEDSDQMDTRKLSRKERRKLRRQKQTAR